MVRLKHLLLENKTKEELVLSYIKDIIRGTKFENKTFVAGGYVRDMIMGKKSKDIDIVVAMPNGGIEFANWITKKSNSYKDGSNPVIYPAYGTAKFNLRGVKYNGVDISNIDLESVMTRKEQYKDDSRKPDVEYGTPHEDVERRDLTINSLLYDISNEKVLDLTGKGLDDIKNHIIRTPIDSDIIFKEDPLRMLRAIRFAVRYNWELSDDMLNSLENNSRMLKNISKERIQDELNKILLSDNPVRGIEYLMNTNLMKYIIPELYETKEMYQNDYHEFDVFGHTMEVLSHTPKRLEVRLAALLHDIGKIKTKTEKDGKFHFYDHDKKSSEMIWDILKDLKYPNNIIKKISNLAFHHMRAKEYGENAEKVSDKALRKLMNQLGDDLEDLLDLIHADNMGHGKKGWKYNIENQVDGIRDRLKKLGDFSGKLHMPIDGKKIIKWLDIKPGPDIGVIINKFKEEFFENPDKISKLSDVELEKIIKRIYNDIKIKSEHKIKLKDFII